MQMSCSSSEVSLDLVSVSDSCQLPSLPQWLLQKDGFPSSTPHLSVGTWHLPSGREVLSTYLCIWLVWAQESPFSSVVCLDNSLLCRITLVLKSCEIWPVGVSSGRQPWPCDLSLSCFVLLSCSILSSTVRCSRLILCFPCPCAGIGYFSNESWLLTGENGF